MQLLNKNIRVRFLKKVIELKTKLIRFLENVFESILFKYLSIYTFFVFIFYLSSSLINSFIADYLLIEKTLLLRIPSILIFGIFIIPIVFLAYKLGIKKYQPSNILIHVMVSSILFYLMLRWVITKQGWSFIPYSKNWLYIDFIVILLVFAILLIVINSLNQKRIVIEKNPFVSDDPILAKDDDKLNYGQRATYIVDYLHRSNFNKSFTIGIVGPWGNGKSSLISLIERELNDNPETDTLHLKFLPYLNHNESDIISEFFKQLSTEISAYSGKLSNQFLNYSDKLLKTINGKNIFEFLKPNYLNSLSSLSAYDAYDKINSTLNQLNKKYIVFIDDLDRLSNNEVLQILKLVRNTANFKNFIFLIALDKDYVLDSLLVKNEVADHTFVDKFFQLEVYLPEIDKSQLKTDFIEYLKKTDLALELEFVRKLEISIYRDNNLFDEYISNYRSVKRLVNQLVFDFRTLPDELDTNDLLNFTYLKMTFPYAIKFLNKNWSSIIPYNSETNLCELMEAEDNESGNDNISEQIRNFMILNSNQKFNVDFSKYQISKKIDESFKIEESNHLNKQQHILLVKTLIVLFGKENIAESHTSIKFENNLRKLLQQKIQEDDLSEKQFRNIFEIDKSFKNLEELLNEGYANNILNRIAYFNSIDKDEIKKVLLILLYFFDKAFENSDDKSIHLYTVWNILSDFIYRQIHIKKDGNDLWNEKDKKTIWDHLRENYIDDDSFRIISKLRFLALISESRIRLNFSDWGTSEDDLKKISLSLYKNLISEKHDNPWDLGDYSFYHAYSDVRKFVQNDIVSDITKDFWSKNDISLLCAQMVQNELWTIKKFKTDDFVNQLFGSKQKYKDFIKNNLPETITPDLKEYLDFIELESYTSFSNYVIFDFKKFDYVKLKLKKVVDFNKFKDDKYDNMVEVVFESSNKELHSITQNNLNEISGYINSNRYNYENCYYTFIRLETGNFHKALEDLFKLYRKLLINDDIESKIDLTKKSITVNDTDEAIKVISIQPESYNTKL